MARLIPERLRPSMPALLAGSAAAFSLLAALVWHGHRALGVDLSVQRGLGVPAWSQRANQHLGDAAAALGSAPAVIAGSLALGSAVLWRRGRDWAALALTAIGLPVALVVDRVLKPLVGRRYFGTGYRFPSGHAATVTAVIVVAWLLLGPTYGSSWSRGARVTGFVGGCVIIGVVSWGLLATRAHSPIDIVGGWLVGGGGALAGAVALDAVARVTAGAARG